MTCAQSLSQNYIVFENIKIISFCWNQKHFDLHIVNPLAILKGEKYLTDLGNL